MVYKKSDTKSTYSGVQNVFNFNFSGYTKSNETCNIPLKSPIKWLPKMQHLKKNSNFCYF